jgi:hypothetical protein
VVEYLVEGFLGFSAWCLGGVSEADEGYDAGVLGDIEGLPEASLVVVSYPAGADSLEVGCDGHGLEGDGGVDEAPAPGDGVFGGVCSDDGECAGADVAVEEAATDLVFDGLVGD